MTEPKIKRCPFCWGNDIHYDKNFNRFECHDCSGVGPWAGNERRAAELWDNRFDCFSAEHIECLDLLRQRDAEIKRLNKRVAELEEPNIFWPDYCDESTPAESSIEELMEEMEDVFSPYQVQCAREMPDIWVVRLKPEGREEFQCFPTEHEAEQFCQKTKEANNA